MTKKKIMEFTPQAEFIPPKSKDYISDAQKNGRRTLHAPNLSVRVLLSAA